MQTCPFALWLPSAHYSLAEVLLRKLLYAARHCSAIDNDSAPAGHLFDSDAATAAAEAAEAAAPEDDEQRRRRWRRSRGGGWGAWTVDAGRRRCAESGKLWNPSPILPKSPAWAWPRRV